MTKVKVVNAEGYGAHVRSVEEIATRLEATSGSNFLITRHIAPPLALSIHDGTAGTETTIFFGDISDDNLEILNGILTIKTDISAFITFAEMHIARTGGGPASTFTFWVDFSVDGGSTYVPVVESLRNFEIPSDGEGIILTDFSTATPSPKGVKFRLRATNTGAGTISIAAPPDLVVSTGIADGFSSKVAARYILS